MRLSRNMLPLYLILPPLLLTITSTVLASPPPDTAQPDQKNLNLQFEVRPGWYNSDFTFSLQASYQWFKFFSTDLFGRTFPISIHGGVTLRPVEVIFVQGSAGYGDKADQPLHGSPSDADFFYGVRGGVQVPVSKRLVVLMSIGSVWFETKEDELLELGIGIHM